jgi:hypothetical protein
MVVPNTTLFNVLSLLILILVLIVTMSPAYVPIPVTVLFFLPHSLLLSLSLPLIRLAAAVHAKEVQRG